MRSWRRYGRPKTGCPWDLEQNFATIAPYTLEEAYEVADAIARGDLADLEEELGDLLLQVVFHARMAEEQDAFDFGDVVEAITAKLIRRHPHVFGDRRANNPQAVKARCGKTSRRRRSVQKPPRARRPMTSALAGVPLALPALTRALKLQAKAGKVGFDWNDPRAVLRKIREEADEIEEALDRDPSNAPAEVGDLLFAVVNLARHVDADPETLLRQTNRKFERRFSAIEHALAARGKRRKTRRWPKWTRCGTRLRRAERSTFAANFVVCPIIPWRRERSERIRATP